MIEIAIAKLWKPALALVLGAGLFFFGRWSAPVEERIVEKEKRVVVEKAVTQVVQQIDVEELVKRVEQISRRNNIERKVVTVRKPDGTTTTTKTVVDKSETNTKSNSESDKKKTEVKEVVVIKEVIKIEEKVKIVEKLRMKDWSATVDLGYYVPALWGDGLQNNLLPGDMIAGGSISRRILGPFSLGIWANTAWGAGLQLRATW